MIYMQQLQSAPELQVSQWFNTKEPLTLNKLKGKVVVIEAFQMLCPGCVTHGLPQAQKIAALFPVEQVAVIGLHTVFEHHMAMTPVSLEAFIHEYRLHFPIGVDEAGDGDMPKTMEAFRLRGTPSLVIIDQNGMLRANHFGQVHDLQIGAEIAELLANTRVQNVEAEALGSNAPTSDSCDENGCTIPQK